MSGLANLRELLKDPRVPAMAGRVTVFDGDEKHYFINDEGYYVISVLTLHHESPIRANWLFPPGFARLPDVNDEVIVMFDNGEFEGEAYCLAGSWSGTPIPDGEAGEFAPNQVVVLGDRLEARFDTKILLKAPLVEAKSSGPTEPTMKGNTYRSAEDAFFSALNSLVNALAAVTAALAAAAPTLTGTPPQIAAYTAAVSAVALAATAFTAAIATFNTGAPTYLTTVFKAE